MEEPLTPQSILNKSSDDKFLLALNLPPILKDINNTARADGNINLDKLQFSIEGSIVPGINVPNVTVPFGGQNLEVTSYARPAYQKNKVRFTVDNRFTNWWVLWKWLNVMNDAKLSIYNKDGLIDASIGTKPNMHNYQTDISVIGLDEYNKHTIEFKYHKAFVTSLGGIEYDYQKQNQILSYFEFAYSQLHVTLL